MTKFSNKQKSILRSMPKQPVPVDLKKDLSLLVDFGEVIWKLSSDSNVLLDAQKSFMADYIELYGHFIRRMALPRFNDENAVTGGADKRFKHEKWCKNPFFEFLRDYYLISAKSINTTIASVKGVEEKKKNRVQFFTKQVTDALSPTNYLATNPELIELTCNSWGDNILEGMNNFLNDLSCADGNLTIKMTDPDAFEFGVNIALSQGKVVYQNDIIQLIQYAPTTKKVFSTPIFISPPWINKFYILDLNEKISLVKWLVDQGYTVFMISWVNADSSHAEKTYESYVLEGHTEALDIIEKITGVKKVSAIGYCTGGTLLASTAAYLAAKGEERFASLTYMATLMDFSKPGDLGVFLNVPQVQRIFKDVANVGYLDGRILAKTFNMLKSNDLVWSYAVNNYLKGIDPVPFDILYWNSDSTNVPARMFSFYLQNMYLENNLRKPNGIMVNEIPIDLAKITTPSYFLTTEDDHIVLWKGSYNGALLHSGPVRFILGGSGHVAGVVNPPAKNKYGYRFSDELPETADAWIEDTHWEKGSWWLDWYKWNMPHAGKEVAARIPGKGKGNVTVIEDAPGSYAKKSLAPKGKCQGSCSCKKPSRRILHRAGPQ